ncbi:hypothetical protein MWH28_11905 [Natroniella sulfidigena]|uniref:hypothetical protein n=1 Tax=Natroniella sulfidigena TaxID=723921 RepID=UPI00200B458C|nr:hypothetical protein [Natroniella sulfidigena]MCK8818062.1 hypothetical protein [Natroniella sulfidigena]
MKIDDTIVLGGLAGIVGTIPSLLFNFIAVQLGFMEYYTFEIASSIYMLEEFTRSPLSVVLGFSLWMITSAILGVLIIYLFRVTGRDYWWFKGPVLIVGIMYIGIYGFFYDVGAWIVPNDATSNMILFLDNLLFSVVASYFIVRWGKEVIDT